MRVDDDDDGDAMSSGPFFGKYRGTVVDKDDPRQIGRIRALVPVVTGDEESVWAMPCVPFGSDLSIVPDIGTQVWIEFEQGDPSHPIWTGCWWSSSADVPQARIAQPTGTQQTPSQQTPSQQTPSQQTRAQPAGTQPTEAERAGARGRHRRPRDVTD
jgi:hypothetical protein